MLDSLKDLILVYGMDGRILYANDTVCRVLGYSREELLARNVNGIVAAPYNRLLGGRVKKLKAEGELIITTSYRKKGGGAYPAETRCAVTSMAGKPCVLCIARGVPRGEKTVRDLGEARERYRRLVEGLRGEYFFYQHGADGVFTYISPSIKDVLGYTQAQFLKHYMRYVTDNPLNKSVVAHTTQSLKGRQQPAYLIELRHARGGTRMLEVLEVPVKDGDGRVTSVEGIAHDITGRLREKSELEAYREGLEGMVEERTAELKAVFERAPIAIILLDEKLNVVRVNSGNAPGTGAKKSLIGEVLKCVNAVDGECGRGRSCASCAVRAAVRATRDYGRTVSRREASVTTADGQKISFLLSTAVIRVKAEKRLLLCLDDITPQKAAEESARAAEEFSRLILSSAGDGIIGVDTQGRVLFMNSASEAMLGWTLAELKGKAIHPVIHHTKPDGRAYPVKECPMHAAYTEQRESIVQDEMLWRRDGTGFYVRYSAHPMYRRGVISGAVVTFNDVSARRRAEEELRANKERLQAQNALLTSLGRSRGAAASDLDAAFREAAETAAEALDADRVGVWLFNEDRTALVCRDFYDRPSRTHAAGARFERAAYPSYFRLLETERAVAADDAAADFRLREFRDPYLKPNNVTCVLDVTVPAGERTAGMIRAERVGRRGAWRLDEQNMLGAVSDFIALAVASAERAKLESMKDFLTHTIVHDLKNPLASIICAGQLLAEDMRGHMNADQRENLDILNQQAEELKRMVSNILDINRMEEGKLPIRAVLLSPGKLLRDAAGTLKVAAAAERKRVRVRAVPAGLPDAQGDEELLRRVLENLLANALKFTPPGTDVDAGAAAGAAGLEFYVSDRGPGIPAEYHARIFEKFVQLEDIGPRKWGGKGLGLAFCKLAVEAHGGRIWVESVPGRGSVFRFTVPFGKGGAK
jgi:PAS domain S-box-containing protein